MKFSDLLLLPNVLTILRILFIVPSIYFLHNKFFFETIFCITFMLLTDLFDGRLARKLNQVSLLGSILDPIADKLVVISMFTYLFLSEKVPLFYYVLILVRDVSQLSVIPVLLFWKKIIFKVKPKLIPKWGTALNFIILGLLGLTGFYEFLLQERFFMWLVYILILSSSLIEIYILITFFPRYYQIYLGRHDTFE